MPDRNGWLTRSEAAECGKPIYITGGPGWRPARPEGWLLLPRYRCAELGRHVGPGEQPAAYLHVARAIPPHSYAPLFVRSMDQLDVSKLTEAEMTAAEQHL
ncbi:hypothetical protein D3C73_1248830 [compost metagenome]